MPRVRGKRRKRRTEAEWSEILRRLESSGLSPRSFCRREGLALSSLQRWRRQIDATPAGQFVEVVPSMSPESAPSGWTLELALPNGTCLRLRG